MSSELQKEFLQNELNRIITEQETALTVLKKLGVEEKMRSIRDELWGGGEVENAVGIIDLHALDWVSIDVARKKDPDLWKGIEPDSYLRTLRNKLEFLEQGDIDLNNLSFGLDPQRFRGWAGISLVLLYPDLTSSDIRSGLFGVDYTRIGPGWYIARENLTVATYPADDKTDFILEVYSKTAESAFALSTEPDPKKAISDLLLKDSIRRIAGVEDVKRKKIVRDPRLERNISQAFRQVMPVNRLGIETNTFSGKDSATLLYLGFLNSQIEKVARECNNPRFRETNRDHRFTREEFDKQLSIQRPNPSIPYHPNQPLRWLLDTKVLVY